MDLADNKNKRGRGRRNSPSSNLERLDQLRQASTAYIFNTDQTFRDENNQDLNNIRNTINQIRQTYKQTTGDDIIEFFNRYNFEKRKEENIVSAGGRHFINLNNLVEDPDNAAINDILFLEGDRVSLYHNYEIIYEHIPQLAQALDTYVDNILSPDDFTKDVFNLFYDGETVRTSGGDDASEGSVIRRLRHITKTYKLEEKASTIIRDTLMKGDQFVAIFKLEKELETMLTEHSDRDLFPYSDRPELLSEGKVLTSHDIPLTEEDIQNIQESGIFDMDEFVTESGNLNIDANTLAGKISECINKNVIYTTSKDLILEEDALILEDFTKHQSTVVRNTINFGMPQRKTDNAPLRINGSVLKVLEPERVIKLALDDMVFGYYYIEKVDDENFGKELSSGKQAIGLGMAIKDVDVEKYMKTNLITDLFIRGISEKIDKKFIRKNKDFKHLIYNLLRQGYIIDKQIQITYIPPDEVVHFYINEDGDYGNSILKKVLFVAKLYLAVLTSTLMTKLVRSSEKRVFYIEVGLDNDAEQAVQNFVRDIKNKELKMADLQDINTVLNNPGQFSDYYIPTINGERPIEIDTLPGMDADMDNEFLEYLLRAMLSGMGVPSSFLQYTEDVEFVRTLAMQNGKFVRAIIHYQKQFGSFFSEVYRKLYKNEYMYDENKSSDGNNKKNDRDDGIVYDKIEVKFPPPSSLNMTALSEQINNSRDIIEFIVSTILGEHPSEEEKHYARKAVTMNMLPSIDWEKFEELIKESMIEKNKDDLSKVSSGDDDSGGYY